MFLFNIKQKAKQKKINKSFVHIYSYRNLFTFDSFVNRIWYTDFTKPKLVFWSEHISLLFIQLVQVFLLTKIAIAAWYCELYRF